jgi:hypothetical protein
MAMSTETSGVDYGRYATYHTQKDLSNMDPEQWMKLVDLARDDLHTNYEFSGEEYPLEVKFETMHQRLGRHEIIKGWGVMFPDWNLTPVQYTSVLMTLFYAIWAQDIATGRRDLTTGCRTFPSAQATVRQTKSMNYNHARFIDTPPDAQNAATERLQPDVQPTKILQHLLEKAVEKFGKRYSGWIQEHPNAVEELSSLLRSEVWDICKEVGKDGFALKQ